VPTPIFSRRGEEMGGATRADSSLCLRRNPWVPPAAPPPYPTPSWCCRCASGGMRGLFLPPVNAPQKPSSHPPPSLNPFYKKNAPTRTEISCPHPFFAHNAPLLRSNTSLTHAVGTARLSQHAPVYTMGKRPTEHNILADAARLTELGVEVHRTRRGGDVTYHGPGQFVLYPIVNLRGLKMGARAYVEGEALGSGAQGPGRTWRLNVLDRETRD